MPEIQAFRGIRYDLGHVGSLSDVIAPPYDVIGPELQDQLYKQHPANVVRLDPEPRRAGRRRAQQPLHPGRQVLEELAQARACCAPSPIRPSTSTTRSSTTAAGRYTRRGFMARVPAAAVRRRARSTRTKKPCPAPRRSAAADPRLQGQPQPDLRPLSRSQTTRPRHLLDAAIAGITPLEATDHLGVVHRLWPVTDVDVISAVSRGDRPQAGVHRRRPSPLRNGLQLPRRAGRRRRRCRPTIRPTSC